jgi:hypothetical protein
MLGSHINTDGTTTITGNTLLPGTELSNSNASVSGGNFITDSFSAIGNWIHGLGSFVMSILSGPTVLLKCMVGLPAAFSSILTVAWFLFSTVIIFAWWHWRD